MKFTHVFFAYASLFGATCHANLAGPSVPTETALECQAEQQSYHDCLDRGVDPDNCLPQG